MRSALILFNYNNCFFCNPCYNFTKNKINNNYKEIINNIYFKNSKPFFKQFRAKI